MARLGWLGAVGSLACLASACHLAGGLTDLDFVDPVSSSTTVTTTSSSSNGGAGATSTGGAGGAGGAGGESSQAPCHAPGVEDDFEGSSLDSSLWDVWQSQGNMTFGVAGGVAFVQPPADLAGSHSGDIFPNSDHDMTGCATWVEVVRTTESSAPTDTYVGLWHGNGNRALFQFEQGTLSFQVETGSTVVASASVPYSPSEHRWVRFREDQGTLHQETSADGLDWSMRMSTPTPSWITSVRIYLGASTFDATPNPGRGEFDNVNLLP